MFMTDISSLTCQSSSSVRGFYSDFFFFCLPVRTGNILLATSSGASRTAKISLTSMPRGKLCCSTNAMLTSWGCRWVALEGLAKTPLACNKAKYGRRSRQVQFPHQSRATTGPRTDTHAAPTKAESAGQLSRVSTIHGVAASFSFENEILEAENRAGPE